MRIRLLLLLLLTITLRNVKAQDCKMHEVPYPVMGISNFTFIEKQKHAAMKDSSALSVFYVRINSLQTFGYRLSIDSLFNYKLTRFTKDSAAFTIESVLAMDKRSACERTDLKGFYHCQCASSISHHSSEILLVMQNGKEVLEFTSIDGRLEDTFMQNSDTAGKDLELYRLLKELGEPKAIEKRKRSKRK